MGVAQDVIHKVGHAIGGVRAGASKLVSRKLGGDRTVAVMSPAFQDGQPLPLSATKEGEGIPPEIAWESVPPGTQSIVVLCEDPDAPMPEPYVHWIVYDLDPDVRSLTQDTLPAARIGKNSTLKRGFTPAAPPAGHGVHHYHFEVLALDTRLGFADGVGRRELVEAMEGHVLGWGEVCGTYERK